MIPDPLQEAIHEHLQTPWQGETLDEAVDAVLARLDVVYMRADLNVEKPEITEAELRLLDGNR